MIYVDITKPCDNRKVVIQHLVDGEWKTKSDVFACSHRAAQAFMDLTVASMGTVIAGMAPTSIIPKLEDYRLVYIDELPKELDTPVEDLTQACDLLNSFRH